MTPELIARCTGASLANALIYAQPLNDAMARFNIDTPRRQSAFLATVGVESGNLREVEEDLYYKDAARLAKIYRRHFSSAAQALPFTRNSSALGKLLYGGYWGRGLLRMTWERNYRVAGIALKKPYLLQPSMVKEPVDAALTAAWFWAVNGCNKPADVGDMTGVTLIVNGPALMHLDRRIALSVTGMETLA